VPLYIASRLSSLCVMDGGILTLTVSEAAKALGIGRNLAYEAIQRGEIPSLRIGRRVVVPRAALAAMLSGSGEQNKTSEPPAHARR
jgi:excisionase family DNA binding protein